VSPPNVQSLVDGVAPPPVTLAPLSMVLADERPQAHRLEEVVRQDPGLMVRLLAVANSAAYGRGESITDVRRAIVRLGVREACKLAMALSSGFLADPLTLYGGTPWRSALYTAVVAEKVGRALNVRNVGSLYTAGLLCDVGKLAVEAAGRELAADPAVSSFLEIERSAVGADHAQLSAALLHKWGLPAELVDLVAHHHNPLKSKNPRACTALHLADAIVRQVVCEGDDALQYPVQRAVARGLGLKPDEIDRALLEANDFFQSIDEVM